MIVRKIKRTSWKKVLPYILENCDEVLFTRRYDIWKAENTKLFDVISSSTDVNKALSLIDYDILVANKEVNNIMTSEGVLTDDIKYRKWYLFVRLSDILIWRQYEKIISEFVDKYPLVATNDYIFHEDYMKGTKFYGFCYKTIYTFKLNDDLKSLLSASKSIYEWAWPDKIEDICFRKNGKIWLYTIANRHICEIFCENEKEYEYLKSNEIEFDTLFTKSKPITIDDLANL